MLFTNPGLHRSFCLNFDSTDRVGGKESATRQELEVASKCQFPSLNFSGDETVLGQQDVTEK